MVRSHARVANTTKSQVAVGSVKDAMVDGHTSRAETSDKLVKGRTDEPSWSEMNGPAFKWTWA
jgi:hypothetical protein